MELAVVTTGAPKTAVKMLPPTYRHSAVYRSDALSVAHRTVPKT